MIRKFLRFPAVFTIATFLFGGLITFSSCKVSHTQLQVLQPADIMLPAHFQKFILVDRTRPPKTTQGQAINIIEGLLTGEGVFQDRWGAEDCLEGLRQELTRTPRYTVTIAPVDTSLKGTGTRQMAAPLDWKTVARMLNNDTATALVVLEAFDSNTNILNEVAQIPQRAADGTTTNVPGIRAIGRVNVYSVWRIYDLKHKTIVDQYPQESQQQFDNTGINAQIAESGLPTKRQMVSRAGVSAGIQYGHRIAPQWIWVAREYYRKGNPEMKSAARLVRFNGWQQATDTWNKQATNADRKIAGRASFNMALAAEQSGDIDLALQWIDRAIQFGDRRAPRYQQILQQRKFEIQKLEEQMKSKK